MWQAPSTARKVAYPAGGKTGSSDAIKSPRCWTWRCKTCCLSSRASVLFWWDLTLPCSVLSYTESVQLVLLFYRSSWLSFVSGLLKDFGSLNTVEIGLRRLPKLERRQFALRDGHEPTGARGKMLRFKCCVWVSS